MPAQTPNKADVFLRGEAFPNLSGKTANYQADPFVRGEALKSFAAGAAASLILNARRIVRNSLLRR